MFLVIILCRERDEYYANEFISFEVHLMLANNSPKIRRIYKVARFYMKCGHYGILYAEDIVWVGLKQFCNDCEDYREIVSGAGIYPIRPMLKPNEANDLIDFLQTAKINNHLITKVTAEYLNHNLVLTILCEGIEESIIIQFANQMIEF